MPFKRTSKIVRPVTDDSTVKVTLEFPRTFWEDYMPRLRSFYEGQRPEVIVEDLTRFAASKDGFDPAKCEPFSTERSDAGTSKKKRTESATATA